MTTPSPADRHVACALEFGVPPGGATVVLQVAVADQAMAVVDEHLSVAVDGEPSDLVVTEVAAPHGGRLHVLRAPEGDLQVAYAATARPAPGEEPPRGPVDAIDPEALAYLRQSRYCPSDELAPFAEAELGSGDPPAERVAAVAAWVFERIAYELGASGPLDSAVDTLLAGRGVCRDFAHLTVALCRALEVPARLAAVYAPGLSPMDFHAVAEVRVEGRWQVVDATRLAPRSSLVRIATGRDAADTAFVTSLDGHVELRSAEVVAVVDGDLPADDHVAPMRLL